MLIRAFALLGSGCSAAGRRGEGHDVGAHEFPFSPFYPGGIGAGLGIGNKVTIARWDFARYSGTIAFPEGEAGGVAIIVEELDGFVRDAVGGVANLSYR